MIECLFPQWNLYYVVVEKEGEEPPPPAIFLTSPAPGIKQDYF